MSEALERGKSLEGMQELDSHTFGVLSYATSLMPFLKRAKFND